METPAPGVLQRLVSDHQSLVSAHSPPFLLREPVGPTMNLCQVLPACLLLVAAALPPLGLSP